MKKNKVINCSKCTITLCEECEKLNDYTAFDSWLQSVSKVKIKEAPIVYENGSINSKY